MAGRAWWRTPISKGLTPTSIPPFSRMKRACKGCSNNFRFPEVFPAMLPPRHRDPSMKAGNWAMPWCVVGDGESETGPLAASWHSNKFLNPRRDGAVLPILHLNGYKSANPTVLGRLSDEQLNHLFTGYGYEPHFVEGDHPEPMHQLMAATLD